MKIKNTLDLFGKIHLLQFIIALAVSPTFGQVNTADGFLFEDIVFDTERVVPIEKYRFSQGGLGYSTIRDQSLSPLLYQGIDLNFQWGMNIYRNNRLNQHQVFTKASIYGNSQTENTIAQYGLEYRYAWLFRLRGVEGLNTRFYAGPMANFLFNFRLHPANVNNALAYDLAMNISPSALVEHKFQFLKREWMVSNQLSIPILGIVSRPGYAWPIPPSLYEPEAEDRSDVIQAGSLNRQVRVHNQLSLDFHRTVKRKGVAIRKIPYRFSYHWDFLQIAQPNRMQSGSHYFMFSRIIKL